MQMLQGGKKHHLEKSSRKLHISFSNASMPSNILTNCSDWKAVTFESEKSWQIQELTI